jgi:hypothetical protein
MLELSVYSDQVVLYDALKWQRYLEQEQYHFDHPNTKKSLHRSSKFLEIFPVLNGQGNII